MTSQIFAAGCTGELRGHVALPRSVLGDPSGQSMLSRAPGRAAFRCTALRSLLCNGETLLLHRQESIGSPAAAPGKDPQPQEHPPFAQYTALTFPLLLPVATNGLSHLKLYILLDVLFEGITMSQNWGWGRNYVS